MSPDASDTAAHTSYLLATDVSLGDAWIASTRPRSCGEQLMVRFAAPGRKPLAMMRAVVTRARRSPRSRAGFGIVFEALDDEQLGVFAHFLHDIFRPPSARVERRRSTRVAVDLPCRLEIDGRQNEGRIIDLGLGGARVQFSAPFECEPLRSPAVLLMLPRSAPAQAVAVRLTRVEPEHDAAFTFLRLDEASAAAIETLMWSAYVER